MRIESHEEFYHFIRGRQRFDDIATILGIMDGDEPNIVPLSAFGYGLFACRQRDGTWRYAAGCCWFTSEEAVEHWSENCRQYGVGTRTRARAEIFLAAIRAFEEFGLKIYEYTHE